MINYIRSIFFIATLSTLLSFPVLANVERYVKKEIDLIVWANVIDKNTGFTIELYKHKTLQSKWRASGHKELKMILLEKYNTDEFTHRVILPGVCYVYYTEANDEGKVSHYLSSSQNMSSQFAKSETVKEQGGTVIDFGCVR